MPKILRIFNRMIIGGPALNVSLLTHFLAPKYETKLVVGIPDPHEKTADFLLERFQVNPIVVPEMSRSVAFRNDLISYRKIKAIIEEFKPDIVHTHAAKPGAIGRLAAAKCKVPVILHTYHGHYFHSYFSPWKTRAYLEIEKHMAKKSTRIIAISEQQKMELSDTYRIAPADKFEVIPLGLFLEPFQTNIEEKRKSFRTAFGLDDDFIAIGIIGRLAPIKNHRLFVEAIDFLRKHSEKKIKAFIVGNGECMEEIKGFCQALSIGYSLPESPDFSQPIIFTSWRTDIDVVNAGLDIITLTSLNEGTPVSIIEAQASSKPIVSTLCGGIQDIIIENETGLLSKLEDQQSFFDNLLKLVDNGCLRNKMSEKGAQWAQEKFSHHRLIADMDKLYEKLLAEKSR